MTCESTSSFIFLQNLHSPTCAIWTSSKYRERSFFERTEYFAAMVSIIPRLAGWCRVFGVQS